MWKLDIEEVAALDQTEGRRLRLHTPEEIVSGAISRGCRSIASTYNEPTVSSEFSHQVFKLAKSKGLFTIYVTNGFESSETLKYLGPFLDAVNIDLKSFREEFYSSVCGAHLHGVCSTIRRCVAMGIHTEISTLVIPGANDSDDELRDCADFLASVDCEIAWHILAYHDDYKFQGRGRTPTATLERARAIGRAAGLKYVYARTAKDTTCPKCGTLLVERERGRVRVRMARGRCACGEVVPGMWADARNLRAKVDEVPADDLQDAVFFAGLRETAQRFAEEVGRAIGFPVIDIANVRSVAKLRRVVFCVSTYGRGTPPKPAAEFWAMLAAMKEAIDVGEFAVLGCGSSSFPGTFCAFAKNLEQKLVALGFREVAPMCLRDEMDQGSDSKVTEWISQLKFS
jgi:pyruvate formate lyase activating enzyme